MDYYLKFDNEEAAAAVLYTEVPVAWDNTDIENPIATEWEQRANYANIDTIGVISEGGEWDEEGNVVTAPVALEGWHVNVRLAGGEDGAALDAFAVTPEQPRRVWA